MSQNLSEKPGIIGVSIAPPYVEVLEHTRVPTRQLLSAALNALFHERKATAVQAAEATGIDGATLSKFKSQKDHLWRWPTDGQFDALAGFFGVEPYVLLKPDAVLAGRLADIGRAPDAHRALPDDDIVVTSDSPTLARGGSDVQHDHHADRELLSALHQYWDAMTPEHRLELVAQGRRFKIQDSGGQPSFARR